MIIDRTAYDAMIQHMQEAAPREGVGLLAGPRDRCPRDTDGDGNCGQRYCPACGIDAVARVADRWVPLGNAAEHPRARYEVADGDLVDAWQALEDDGRRPWVIVHSHVRTSAAPSETDIRYAVDPSLLHMIVSLGGVEPVAVLWRLNPNTVAPNHAKRVRYEVVDLGRNEYPATDLTRGVSSA